MKQHATATKLVVALVLTVIIIGVSAFRQKAGGQQDSFRTAQKHAQQDTSTRRKHNGPMDARHADKLDATMRHLDEEMKKLDTELKKMDFGRMEKEINQSMKEIDAEKIGRDVEAAIKKIDFEKVGKEIEASMKKVDWEKINKEIEESMVKLREVEMPKLKAEMEKVRAQLVKERMDVKVDGEKIRKDVEKAMQGAKESIAQAREEVKELKAFTDALQSDGLIDKKKSYKIEVNNGELFINDKKQPKEVYEKYKRYYKKDRLKIEMEPDDRI